jgi:hypothetical protein
MVTGGILLLATTLDDSEPCGTGAIRGNPVEMWQFLNMTSTFGIRIQPQKQPQPLKLSYAQGPGSDQIRRR